MEKILKMLQQELERRERQRRDEDEKIDRLCKLPCMVGGIMSVNVVRNYVHIEKRPEIESAPKFQAIPVLR